MADGTRVSQLAKTIKTTQESQKEFQKQIQDSLKAAQQQFQEAKKNNLEIWSSFKIWRADQ
jgi:CRISPR/Cas system CMR subunit Cmr4 (Cas7 group RAMP superfamily)